LKPDVAAAVATAIESVLRDTGRDTKPVEPPLLLANDLGLDSLDLAQTIVLLERSLGIDPFRSASTSRTVRTVSDLIAIYETALNPRSA
jgi:acyl carrier protein